VYFALRGERGRSVTDDRAVPPRDHGAEPAGGLLPYPYLGLDIDNSRLMCDVRDSLYYSVLVAHIFSAMVTLVLGPPQFIPRYERVRGSIERSAGSIPSSGSSVGGGHDPGRGMVRTPVTQTGLTTAAARWLITGGLACRSARWGDFIAHRPGWCAIAR